MTKHETLNYIFKSKDGASWNEVSEVLRLTMGICDVRPLET